jgi:hypothetical protein
MRFRFGLIDKYEYSHVAEEDGYAWHEYGSGRKEYRIAWTGQSIPHAVGRLRIEKVPTPAKKIWQIDQSARYPCEYAQRDCSIQIEIVFVDSIMANVNVSVNS